MNPTYLLAWIPETLLCEKGTDEWDKFVKIEEKATLDEEDEGPPLFLCFNPEVLPYSKMLFLLTFLSKGQSPMHSRSL